jgi:uncharacterized protein
MAKAENHIDYLELPATDSTQLEAAVHFYTHAFGWSFQQWGDEYADTKHSGVNSGLNADASHRPKAPLPVIYTAKLEQKRQQVLAAGGRITRDIFPFPGGRRFHFRDPAGNELAVWSDVDEEQG